MQLDGRSAQSQPKNDERRFAESRSASEDWFLQAIAEAGLLLPLQSQHHPLYGIGAAGHWLTA